jgi:large subunit ribosomal protein L13
LVIDCEQKLGRLATIITLLKGKVKPHYYPSIDTGDYIILINDLIVINEKSIILLLTQERSFFKNKECR